MASAQHIFIRRPQLRYLLSCVLLLCLTFATELLARPLIVLSDDTRSYQKVLHGLRDNYKAQFDIIDVENLTRPGTSVDPLRYDYIVAVGSRATSQLLQALPAEAPPLLSTFIPRRSYHTLLQKYQASSHLDPERVTAIYLDQPYQRQLRLARLVRPDAHTLSVAFSRASAKDLPLLEEALVSTGFSLEHKTLDASSNPIKQLQPLLESSDLFLTLPDKAVFNRTTAKWILYISFRLRVPLIGFSRKYVEAGAIAGVYSTPEQIGRQTGETMRFMDAGYSILPAPAYPRYFSVATNPSAAKKLRIPIASQSFLEDKLREAEQ